MMEKQTLVWKTTERCALDADVQWGEKNRPAILFFHGGALLMCHKGIVPSHLFRRFQEMGYTTISVNYRLAPCDSLEEIANDIQDAVVWSKELLEKRGYYKSQLISVGHSAGGYLALLSGTCPNRPHAVVSVYGYGDLLAGWCSAPSNHYKNLAGKSERADLKLTGHTGSREPSEEMCQLYYALRAEGRWLDFLLPEISCGESRTDLLKRFSPLYNLNCAYPPALLIHGLADKDVPCGESERFVQALHKIELPAKLVLMDGVGHSFDFDANSLQCQKAAREIVDFIESTEENKLCVCVNS